MSSWLIEMAWMDIQVCSVAFLLCEGNGFRAEYSDFGPMSIRTGSNTIITFVLVFLLWGGTNEGALLEYGGRYGPGRVVEKRRLGGPIRSSVGAEIEFGPPRLVKDLSASWVLSSAFLGELQAVEQLKDMHYIYIHLGNIMAGLVSTTNLIDYLDWEGIVDDVFSAKDVPDNEQVPNIATRFRGRAREWWQTQKQLIVEGVVLQYRNWEDLKKVKAKGTLTPPDCSAPMLLVEKIDMTPAMKPVVFQGNNIFQTSCHIGDEKACLVIDP
ncbi:hypothetical protein IFM89_022582, partial [Coptis chinensis]